MNQFYQFALDKNYVEKKIARAGFRRCLVRGFGAVKGLKDEVGILKPNLQRVYDGRGLFPKIVRGCLNIMFGRTSGHSLLLVFRKGR